MLSSNPRIPLRSGDRNYIYLRQAAKALTSPYCLDIAKVPASSRAKTLDESSSKVLSRRASVIPKRQEAGHLTHGCKFPSRVSWNPSSSSGAGRLAIKPAGFVAFVSGSDLLPKFNRELSRFRLCLRKGMGSKASFQ